MNDEKSKKPHHGHGLLFQLGLFLGGALGAVMMYLIGTDEGKKISKDAVRKKDDWIFRLEEILEELEQKGLDVLEKGQELSQELQGEFQEKKGEVTEKVLKNADKTLEHIEKLQERGRKTTAIIRKKYFKNTKKK